MEQYINFVNNFYQNQPNEVLIHFYLKCAIKRIGTSMHAIIGNDAEAGIVLASDNETDCINVHFVNEAPFNGLSRFPWMSLKYSCIVKTQNTMNITNTLAHELGHSLGLPHTFNTQFTPVTGNCRNNCFQECVSRTRTQEGYYFFTAGKKKCEVNGDCFCDTHADIRDGGFDINGNPIGNYNGEFANCSSFSYDVSSINTLANCLKWDNYGDQWYGVPLTNAMNNMMSYWRPCRTNITKMQRGAMYIYSSKKGVVPLNNNSSSFYTNIDVDNYENDNVFHPTLDENDNLMTINTRQYHTFHLNGATACDVDWVYFQLPNNTVKPYVIQTQEVLGKAKPDTKITLYAIKYDGTLIQLAQHDNNSTTDLFSKITQSLPYSYNFPSFGTLYVNNYSIKIENNITNTSDARNKGHYYLRVDECFDKTNVAIVGDATICTSKPYSVSSLPAGASVIWSVIPVGAVTFANKGNSTVATKATNSNATIKATITMCGVSYELTKVVGLGLPYTLYPVNGSLYQEAIMETDLGEGPCNTQCYSPGGPNINWSAPEAYNATSTTWQKTLSLPANYNFWSANNNTVSLFFKVANQSVELRRTLTNVCGSVQQYYCFGSNTTLCPAPMMVTSTVNQTLKVYPNPTLTGSTITLELFVEEQQIDFENATIQLIDKSNIILFEKVGKKILKEELDIQSVSSGTYYVTVTNLNGSVSQELIVNSGQ